VIWMSVKTFAGVVDISKDVLEMFLQVGVIVFHEVLNFQCLFVEGVLGI